MKNEQALYIMFSLPDDSPLIELIRREHFPEAEKLSREHRLWYGNRDAALGYHLAFTYFQARRKVPKEIWWPVVRRAYRCLEAPAETRRTDPVCHEVLAFAHPINMGAQAILKGYLCCKLSYAEMATRFGRSVEFVTLYAQLFCDFPERRDSEEFVTGVLDPQGERGCFQTDLSDLVRIADPGLRLMNIGFWYGPDVLAAAKGRVFDGDAIPSEAGLLNNARRWLLIRSQPKSINGTLTSNDPGFVLAKTMIAAEAKHSPAAKDDDLRMGLEALSMAQGAQLVLKKLIMATAEDQLKAAQIYDATMAEEKAKKKAAGSSGDPPGHSAA